MTLDPESQLLAHNQLQLSITFASTKISHNLGHRPSPNPQHRPHHGRYQRRYVEESGKVCRSFCDERRKDSHLAESQHDTGTILPKIHSCGKKGSRCSFCLISFAPRRRRRTKPSVSYFRMCGVKSPSIPRRQSWVHRELGTLISWPHSDHSPTILLTSPFPGITEKPHC
jgi:hypothetical protein